MAIKKLQGINQPPDGIIFHVKEAKNIFYILAYITHKFLAGVFLSFWLIRSGNPRADNTRSVVCRHNWIAAVFVGKKQP